MQRMLELERGINFRELGGYTCEDGRHVKWHKLLRSGNMCNLSNNDLVYLDKYGLRYVVDLRSDAETSYTPDRISRHATYYNYSVYPFSDSIFGNLGIIATLKLKEHQLNYANTAYIQMLVDRHAQAAYRKMFDLLLENDKDNECLVFHCTAGKDRTGIGAFLVLTALGVKKDEIMQDYLLTNLYFAGQTPQQINGMLTADSSMLANKMNAQLAVSRDNFDILSTVCQIKYGSVDNYLHDIMQLDEQKIAKLKKIYLE